MSHCGKWYLLKVDYDDYGDDDDELSSSSLPSSIPYKIQNQETF